MTVIQLYSDDLQTASLGCYRLWLSFVLDYSALNHFTSKHKSSSHNDSSSNGGYSLLNHAAKAKPTKPSSDTLELYSSIGGSHVKQVVFLMSLIFMSCRFSS
jgi:hypothetical protein